METISKNEILDRLKRFGSSAQPKPRIRVPSGPQTEPKPKSKLPKVSLLDRAASKAGTLTGKALPYVKALPAVGTAYAIGSSLISDVDKTVENRTFPKASAVADITRQRQAKADGFIDRELEGIKGALPLMGGLMNDAADYVGGFFGSNEAPIAKPSTKVEEPSVANVKEPTVSGQLGYQAELGTDPVAVAPPTPATMVPQDNDSYFVNNQTGVAPKERQYLRDMPQRFKPREEAEAEVAASVRQPYQSPSQYDPMEQEAIPAFDPSTGSYGDLIAHTFKLSGEARRLAGERGKANQIAGQQNQANLDRTFGFEQQKNAQDTGIRIAQLGQGDQRIAETQRNNSNNVLARIRGQDIKGAGKAEKPLSYGDQNKNYNELVTMSSRVFADAPAGFTDLAIAYSQQTGMSPQDIASIYRDVIEAQKQKSGIESADELELSKLNDLMKAQLGIAI